MTLHEDSLVKLEARRQQLDPDDYTFIFFSDTWVGPGVSGAGTASNDIFQCAMEEALKHNPLFILHGGDIVWTGSEELFTYFITKKQQYAPEIPFFITVGNHEMQKTGQPQWSIENFANLIGPVHFTLDLPEYHLTLISLNTLYHYHYNEYGLTEAELDYLSEQLQNRHQHTFVSIHVPPQTDEWQEGFTINRDPFARLIKNKVDRVLVSHIHAYGKDKVKGVKCLLSGCGGATLNKEETNHIVVFKVKDGDISYKKIPVGWE